MTKRTLALVAIAVVASSAGCARMEGRTAWEEAIPTQTAPPAKAPEGAVYPAPAPPFSPGVFPCSRCHEGGEPAKDDRPAIQHDVHLGRGIECADCHFPEGGDPKIPAREVCDTCHGEPEKLSPAARTYFTAVTEADGKTNFPHRWATRDVDPKHARHAKAGVACAACHGEPGREPFAKPRSVTLMARCVACHEQRSQSVKCDACHGQTTQRQHANVVLHHVPEQRDCLDCHDAADRGALHLSNGTKIGFDESFRLCGQCHGTQFRDWKVGLHGKRTGEWNGRREYRLCVHCHRPHEPRFKPMAPVMPPARPEDVR